MNNKLRMFLLGLSLVSVVGCGSQNLNIGAVDYRQMEPAWSTISGSTDCGKQSSNKNSSTEQDESQAESGELATYARYYRADELCGLDILKANDAVSLRILQVFICDFAESGWRDRLKNITRKNKERTPCNPDGRSYAETKGEIVIVADVFEQGDKKNEYRSGTHGADRARVIFYSEDIEETGQYFNLSNIPLYGPVTYTGKPLFLRFFIIEVDEQEAAKLSSTLKQLSGLAKKAYPPGTEVLEILTGIGAAFLSGAQDDLEFQYEMAFDGVGGTATSYAPLSVGTYAFVRKEKRDEPFDWSRVRIEPKTGRLSCTKADTGKTTGGCTHIGAEFRGETYFTLKVVKNEPAIANESVQLMSEFKAQAEKDIVRRDYSNLETALAGLAQKAKNEATFDVARSNLAVLASRNSNPIDCNLALEAYFEGVCTFLSLPENEGIDKARFLLSGLYDIYKPVSSESNQPPSCAATNSNKFEIDSIKWTVANIRAECAGQAETKNYISMWDTLLKDSGEQSNP